METLIAVAIFLILILLFTGHSNIAVIVLSILIVAAAVFMTFFFVINFIVFLFFRSGDAEYSRIEERANGKWRNACYIIDGEEYRCIFPFDGLFVKQPYKENAKCHVRFNAKIGKVYDKYAIITTILGLVFSLGFDAALIIIYVNM